MRPWAKKIILSFVVLSLLMVLGLYRLDKLNSKPIETHNFSWVNKVEIYTLGVIMSLLAAPIYPEVAREHLMLYSPFDKGTKIIKSDFFVGSPLVQKATEQAKKTGQLVRLAWPVSAYQLSFNAETYREARIALALNGGHVRVEGNKIIAKVKVEYPKKSFAPLLPIPGYGVIGVEEGLFWILQQEKWYHTGYVEWVAELTN